MGLGLLVANQTTILILDPMLPGADGVVARCFKWMSMPIRREARRVSGPASATLLLGANSCGVG